ncbi:hypothetical protein AKUH3B111A_00870 [Apilactobacillus kunkeei]|uniref:hypothetical protein n=1 Tax=Apilactobacillus kunkeei TaxID=148814 RepID=UPI00200B4485|nr:hypothetical protein [Apilactobacillus kunkeei]MCK8629418.1 hypothetical protein [Apilactobacillus kunkeei]CAI2553042.1 hypothetical protein AKUH3B104X_00870 [Apilactobacillus kunkeei]CAI2553082.1 hypothetical protein AKUH3B111A_00870 [Apilactobacillus kunkeei]CAI2553126.1 hypothetical protein AKUH3B103M_00870 [Apilactobacillus kunkeei]CAI2553465.1 hypothetical protein AKUH1B302M_00870 [Apilactobacillus kunkeei]
MKINYKSSFLAIILTIALFVFAGFTTSHEHTAFASAKSHAAKTYKWTVGVPKQLQGKSYYTTKNPYTYHKLMWYVYFGKKNLYFGQLVHGKINFKKNEAPLAGNDFYNQVAYHKSGKNYYFKSHQKNILFTNGTNIRRYRTIGTKKVIFQKHVLTSSKYDANKFLKSIGWQWNTGGFKPFK